jgi:hypothetical protein
MLHTTLKLAQDNYVKLAGGHPNQQGVCQSHRGLAIYIKKYLKAKRRIMEVTQIFHHAKIYLIFKKSFEIL